MITIWWQLPAMLWALIILVLTSLPTIDTPDLGFNAEDKLYHFLAYFVLGILLVRGFVRGKLDRLNTGLWRASVIGILLAGFDEFHQLYIPGRDGNLMDATADVFGILFAQLMFFWIYKKYYQKLQLITVNGRKLL